MTVSANARARARTRRTWKEAKKAKREIWMYYDPAMTPNEDGSIDLDADVIATPRGRYRASVYLCPNTKMRTFDSRTEAKRWCRDEIKTAEVLARLDR